MGGSFPKYYRERGSYLSKAFALNLDRNPPSLLSARVPSAERALGDWVTACPRPILNPKSAVPRATEVLLREVHILPP